MRLHHLVVLVLLLVPFVRADDKVTNSIAEDEAGWKRVLAPDVGDSVKLRNHYIELVDREKAERRTYDEHVAQLTALKLAYDELAAKSPSKDKLADILNAEGEAQVSWQEKLQPAAGDKAALDKLHGDLQKEERARPASDEVHAARLGTLEIVYNTMIARLASPEHPAEPDGSGGIWSYLHLAKSSTYSDRAKPAQFGWTRENGTDVYTARGAFTAGYFGTDWNSTSSYLWNWWGGFDFDLSSDTAKNPGKLSQTVSAMGYKKNVGKFDEHVMHWTYLMSVTHDANRNFKSQDLAGQFLIEPVISLGAIPINLRKHGFLFGPEFGGEVGEIFDKAKGKSPEDGGFSRGYMKWIFNVYPAGFKNKLYLYLDDTTRFLGDDDYRAYNLLNGGVTYDLSDEVSLSADYQIGRDAPKFAFDTKLTVGLGLKY